MFFDSEALGLTISLLLQGRGLRTLARPFRGPQQGQVLYLVLEVLNVHSLTASDEFSPFMGLPKYKKY
jgi:hypothetical protein